MTYFRWLSVSLVLAIVAVPARGQDSVDIKWKFEKGKTFYQEMNTKTEQKIKVMGMDTNQTQDMTFYFSWTPEKRDEKAKTWSIKQKIEGLKMTIQVGGNPVSYDSTKDTNTTTPLSEFYKALVGSEFTLTITDDNKVSEIKGKDDFLKKLINANQQMEPVLKQVLSDEALKQMSDPAFSIVPGKTVKKGDTWTKKSTLNLGPIGSYENTYTYTYDGKDDKKLDKIKVDTTMKYIPPGDTAGGALPFKIKSADLKSEKSPQGSENVLLFDSAKGRLVSSTMSMELKGKLTIDISGMTSDVELSQTQKTTLKTTDENPIKKAG